MTVLDTRTEVRELDAELLERCHQRAAGYDRDNRFFTEDFAELRDAGYLKAALPADRGGWGLTLAELAQQQRRLARYAPATALALTMHHYWVGQAADLTALGVPGHTRLLDEVAAGEVLAAGHAEAGNDVSIAMSTCVAEPVEGGYLLTGRKHFTSLSPVWTRLGVHALDASDPADPVVVHAIVERGAPGLTTVEVWDTLGMRATQSHDTVLERVFVPSDRIAALAPVGDSTHPYPGVMSMWALTLIANVYLGIAERAFELAVEAATTKSAVTIPRGSYSTNPFVQHQLAEMFLDLHAATATLDTLAADWSAGSDRNWGALVPSAKWHAVTAAQRIVSRAMDVVGGGSFFRTSELERLSRDVRAGSFHPASDALAHELVARAVLGVADGEPRW